MCLRRLTFLPPTPGFFLLAFLLHSGIANPQPSNQSHVRGAVLSLPFFFWSFSTATSVPHLETLILLGILQLALCQGWSQLPYSQPFQDPEKCFCSRGLLSAFQLPVIDQFCLLTAATLQLNLFQDLWTLSTSSFSDPPRLLVPSVGLALVLMGEWMSAAFMTRWHKRRQSH